MKTKKPFTAICIVAFLIINCQLSIINCLAQAPPYIWAKLAGGTDNDSGNSCCTDAGGNIIATGYFSSSSITFGTTVLTNAGSDDMFIVKYDPSGNVLWAKSTGGASYDIGNSCSTDAVGNIIVTGLLASSSITFGTTVLTNAGGVDMFIVKYDPNGNVLWAKSAGDSIGSVSGYSCSTDTVGNIIATGYFSGSSLTFGTTVLTNAGNQDVFIVKYDPNGNVLWSNTVGGTIDDYGYSCSTDGNGNIIAAGFFNSSSITFGATVLTNAGGVDMFIVKYDPNGNVLWAKSAGGTSFDIGVSCSTDAGGNIFATGGFNSSSITFGTTVLTNPGISREMFIVKYDPSGNVLWAKSEGETGSEEGRSCSTDAGGNIIVIGHFSSSSITFGTTFLTNAGNFDMFIVKYDPNGNVLWAKSTGGTDGDFSNSGCTDANGNIIATGFFVSSSITFGTTVLTNAGDDDMFIVKLSGVTGIEEIKFLNSISVYPNPSSGKFQIINNQFPIAGFEIYNTLGENVYQNKIKQQTPNEINFANQPKGIYYIKIHNEEKYSSEKIIIE